MPGKLIARYSYGIYLFYAPILHLSFPGTGELPFLAQLAMFIVLTAVMSIATYHLLEEPAICYCKSLAVRWFGVGADGEQPDRVGSPFGTQRGVDHS